MIVRIKRWWQSQQAKRARGRLREGIKVLRKLDILMRRAGMSRQERRQTWREIANSAEEREKMLDKLSARLGIMTPNEEAAWHTSNESS